MSVWCDCCLLSGRGLCDGLITRPEDSYVQQSLRVLCVVRYRSLRRADHSSRGVLWMSVCCECCVSSGRGLCDGLITRPEEFYGCLSVVSVVCRQVEFSAPELITRPEASYRTVMRCCV